MNVNDDFSRRVVVHAEDLPWESSPMAGVDRRRLDRVNGKVERVTTIVRYAPGSQFSPHVHTGGEEFIVLEGVFEDDYGQWPAGSYIRNPPTSSHTPGSTDGCTIFVKLQQFQPDDRTYVHANRHKLAMTEERGRPGASVASLYQDEHESVRFERWDANSTITVNADGGVEILVLEGSCIEGDDTLKQHSWLRMPGNSAVTLTTGDAGAVVWIKSSHLRGLKIE